MGDFGAYSLVKGVCVMLSRFAKVLIVLGLLCVGAPAVGAYDDGWKMVHGDVLQVFADQHKILLDVDGVKEIYVLEVDCPILRSGVPVSLESMRPIGVNAYQDALCWVNPQGVIGHILVNYRVQEVDGILHNYDIFGNLK